EDNGFVLYYKSLAEEKFHWPGGEEELVSLTGQQINWLLDGQACLRPRDRFWDIPVPKIDSAFDNLFVPQPSWSPSTAQQLRKLVAAPYLAPI
uniref:IS66 family insertion sequence element accessory protein TnpB n=1 Tax=Thiolapillus sp. TaxID=2017437 RepID=UPI003AF698F4